MATAWSAFYDYVLPNVEKCPKPTAKQKVLEAAIEFCTRSRIWEATSEDTDVEEGQALYTYNPETGAVVVATLRVWYKGVRIEPITTAELNDRSTSWKSTTGQPLHWYGIEPASIRLYPIPDEDEDDALVIEVALKPSRTATTCPDFIFEDWADYIAYGATSKLMQMPGKDWSGDHRTYEAQFMDGVTKAKMRVQTNLTDTSIRVIAPAMP